MLEKLINSDHALSVLNKEGTVFFVITIIFLLVFLFIGKFGGKTAIQIFGILLLVVGMRFMLTLVDTADLPEEVKSVQGKSVEDYYSIYKNGDNLEFELTPKETISKGLKLALENNVTATIVSKTKDSYIIEFKNERYTIPVNSVKDE